MMEKLIFWVAYGIGFIVGYYFHRWALKKYMASEGFEDDWGQVAFSVFIALFAWIGCLITLFICIVFGLFSSNVDEYEDKPKPPKWL